MYINIQISEIIYMMFYCKLKKTRIGVGYVRDCMNFGKNLW